MSGRRWILCAAAIGTASLLLASCGDDGGSSESQSDDTTDEVTDDFTDEVTDDVSGNSGDDGGSACDAVSEYVEASEVAKAFDAELQPSEAIDSNGVCLVQLDIGVVAVAVEPYDSDEEAADSFADIRDVVSVGNTPEDVEVGDEAIIVSGDVNELYVLSGSNLFLVGDAGSLELDEAEFRDGFTAVAEMMTDDA